jgi:hypothetical protein
VLNADGTLTTKNYDDNRNLQSDSWTRPDGAYGSDTYDWGGNLESGEAHYADGSHDTITQDYGQHETLAWQLKLAVDSGAFVEQLVRLFADPAETPKNISRTGTQR